MSDQQEFSVKSSDSDASDVSEAKGCYNPITIDKFSHVIDTYILSMYRNFMSMEWMDVKTLVLPCTTHSRVSGMASGVQVARNTGSSRDDNGKQPK